jgi:tRNA U38,U39,U40 pseudouridine synthase TruA
MIVGSRQTKDCTSLFFPQLFGYDNTLEGVHRALPTADARKNLYVIPTDSQFLPSCDHPHHLLVPRSPRLQCKIRMQLKALPLLFYSRGVRHQAHAGREPPPSVRCPFSFSCVFMTSDPSNTMLFPGRIFLCLQEVALSLEGEHDFRHFCKIDTSKPNVKIHR